MEPASEHPPGKRKRQPATTAATLPEGYLTLRQAAERTGIAERTLRWRCPNGVVAAQRVGRGYLLTPETVVSLAADSGAPATEAATGSSIAEAVRQPATEAATLPGPAEDLATLRQQVAALALRAAQAEKRIAGAHQAARMMAVRLSEALAGLDRERQRAEGLAEELAALRQELREERARHATAERELRVLLLRSSESLSQALAAHQAPALTSSRRRAWWPFGRR